MQDYPRLMGRTLAAEMVGVPARYIDKLRLRKILSVYKTVGEGKSLYFRDEVLKHFNLELT